MIQNILRFIYPIGKANIILANGEFPHNSTLHELLHKATTIICCDGATNKLVRHKLIPDYIIGDCDSLTKTIEQQFRERIIQISDQNSNDLTKAVDLAHKLKLDDIIILGATGLREDHTLANIALLARYSELIKNIAIISDYGIFTIHKYQAIIKTIPGQQISFFSLTAANQITCAELKWPLKQYTMDSWYQGTLNHATHHSINLTSTDQVILYRAFELKP